MSKHRVKSKKDTAEPRRSAAPPPPSPPPPPDPVVEAAREAGIDIPENLSAENPGVPTAPDPAPLTTEEMATMVGDTASAIWTALNEPGPLAAHMAEQVGTGADAFEAGVTRRVNHVPDMPTLEVGHPWDDPRRLVADIERHAKHSHGLTPDHDLFVAIADYIRQSWGVTEEEVPKL